MCLSSSLVLTAAGVSALAQTQPLGQSASDLPAARSQTGAGTEEKSGRLEEVVVTARKRSESAQDVPVALTAFGADELEQRGITGVSGLKTGAIPTLRLKDVAGSPTVLQATIRGFTNPNGTDITSENPVPFYIDDVYFGREQGSALDLTEVDSITVLRGPQGTLFGKNAMGGAVQISSKPPTGEFGLRQIVEGGNIGSWKVITHLDLPKTAEIATKLDFLATDNDGWQKNPAGPAVNGNVPYDPTRTPPTMQEQNFGRVKYIAGRVAMRYQPVDTLTVDFAADYTQARSTGAFNQLQSSSDLYTRSVWLDQTQRIDESQYPMFRPLDHQQFYGARLTANWTPYGSLTVKSITAYRNDSSLEFNTPAPANTLPAVFLGRPDLGVLTAPVVVYDIQHKQFSQELQLIGDAGAGLQWVGGLFFMEERGSQINNTYFSLAFPGTVFGPGPVPQLPGIVSLGTPTVLDPALYLPTQISGADVRNISAAGFGQVTWNPPVLDRKLALTAGLRLGLDEKRTTRPFGFVWDQVTYPARQGAPAPTPPAVPGQVCPCSPKNIVERRALPLVTAAYHWTEAHSTYLSYSTGYRAASVSLSSQTLNPVRSDSVASIELGEKFEFLGRRVRVNLAAFREQWKNPQENASTASVSTVEFFNGPNVITYGLELDSSFAPWDGLLLNVAGAYSHGKDASINSPFSPPGAAPVQQFNHPVDLPKFTGSVSLLYDIARTAYGTWRLNLDVNGTSRYFSNPNIPFENPGYVLLNGRVGIASVPLGANGGLLDVMLYGRNLADKSYQIYDYSTAGVTAQNNIAVFGQKRTYGVALAYRF
jgi:iron complex outermembrane receptor protein